MQYPLWDLTKNGRIRSPPAIKLQNDRNFATNLGLARNQETSPHLLPVHEHPQFDIMTGGHKPMKLPPLRVLRVRDPKRKVENPCIAVMSTVLGEPSVPDAFS